MKRIVLFRRYLGGTTQSCCLVSHPFGNSLPSHNKPVTFSSTYLTQISGKRDDLAVVGLLQPLEDDRRVQATRVGQNHFVDLATLAVGLRHNRATRWSGRLPSSYAAGEGRGRARKGRRALGNRGTSNQTWQTIRITVSTGVECIADGSLIESIEQPTCDGEPSIAATSGARAPPGAADNDRMKPTYLAS